MIANYPFHIAFGAEVPEDVCSSHTSHSQEKKTPDKCKLIPIAILKNMPKGICPIPVLICGLYMGDQCELPS